MEIGDVLSTDHAHAGVDGADDVLGAVGAGGRAALEPEQSWLQTSRGLRRFWMAIYFMGIYHRFQQGDWWYTDLRCRCPTRAYIRISIGAGGPTAECPICRQEYIVFVEGPTRADLWPVHRGQIIGGD